MGDRLVTLRTSFKIMETLLAANQPLTVVGIADRANVHKRSVYRYLPVLEEALHPRLLCVGKWPAQYWMDR
jgi:predicted DNA-binding transcriptional regulator YafY